MKLNEEPREIEINIRDDSNFLSPFSGGDDAVISDELAGFIEKRVDIVYPKEELSLNIRSSCIDDNEKTLYTKAFNKYFEEKSVSAKRELRRNNFIALLFLAVGVLVIALSIFINYNFESEIWAEVLDIVAWVLVWECVDILLFKNRELRLNLKKYNALSRACIRYLAA